MSKPTVMAIPRTKYQLHDNCWSNRRQCDMPDLRIRLAPSIAAAYMQLLADSGNRRDEDNRAIAKTLPISENNLINQK